MNEQFDNPGMAERSDKDVISPDVNSDPFTYTVPVDSSLTHKAPWSEINVHETPKEEMVFQEMPMDGTRVHETLMDVTIAHETPVGKTIAHESPVVTKPASSASLLNREESEHFRTRWNEIQGKFVDESRSAVERADALVSEVVEQITQMFANEHSLLEGKWKQGNDVSTEDLRNALQNYRSFFNRLMA